MAATKHRQAMFNGKVYATMMRLVALACVLAGAQAAAVSAEPFAFSVVDGARVPSPLGGLSGDPVRGAALVQTHCAACHGAAQPVPSWETGRLRLAIIDLAVINPTAPPHAFYAPIASDSDALTAQEIEDVLAALAAREP